MFELWRSSEKQIKSERAGLPFFGQTFRRFAFSCICWPSGRTEIMITVYPVRSCPRNVMQHQELLSQCAAEDRSRLSRTARKRLPRWLAAKMDGSDLVQDTFVELLCSNRITLADYHNCQSLLSVALENNLKDCVRKFLCLKRNSRRELHGDNVFSSLSEQQSMPSDRAQARYQLIQSLLGRLPLPYSAVLEAYYLEGATQEQIGQRLSRSKDAVRMLIRRAEEAAEKILRSDGYSSPSI